MDSAVELLNLILEKSQPYETIRLSPQAAIQIASLGERELGSTLSDLIVELGPIRALEAEGLFSRNVIISIDDTPFVVVDKS